MGKQQESWRETLYGHEKSRTLASRLFVLLRDELGLGRQPKVARLLVDEIVAVVENTIVEPGVLQPGQVLVLAPEVGQGPSWNWRRLEDKRMKTVRLTLIDPADIDRLVRGDPLPKVRQERMARLTKEAFDQGATLTVCQLALMTGIHPSNASVQLNAWMKEKGEILPLRGIVEDCSPAVTHKADIVALHLQGKTTAEIALATSHTPKSVERYLLRFEQVHELVRYLDRVPDPAGIARILGCSEALVKAYIDLMPKAEVDGVSEEA